MTRANRGREGEVRAKGPGDPACTIISAHRGWLDWRLPQLWRYCDLIGLFVWRDFVAVYKQTILGPAWHIIQPLLTTLTFTVIFGKIAGLPTDGAPPFLFYLAGTIVWSYFANSLNNASRSFVSHAHLLSRYISTGWSFQSRRSSPPPSPSPSTPASPPRVPWGRHLGPLAASFAVMLAILSVGLMLFTHVERILMDTV